MEMGREQDGRTGRGVIPLMAVHQLSKRKVRPVLEFRKLNERIECHTGDEIVSCDVHMIRSSHMAFHKEDSLPCNTKMKNL